MLESDVSMIEMVVVKLMLPLYYCCTHIPCLVYDYDQRSSGVYLLLNSMAGVEMVWYSVDRLGWWTWWIRGCSGRYD
jgi:hypothetical protein